MTRLAPARVAGLMMGVWFLASSVGNYIGGLFATVYETFSLPTLFSSIGIYAFAAAVLLGLLIRPINRMMARAE
jgi:POT family proton-dependent oligopeptide transporter